MNESLNYFYNPKQYCLRITIHVTTYINMSESNSLRAKNTGIGATNMWTGTHIRFPEDDIRHFMVRTMVPMGGIRKDRTNQFHGISNDLYETGSVHSEADQIREKDRIHAAPDHGPQYHGTVISVYTPSPHIHASRCLIEWDPYLTYRMPTHPAISGTVIPLEFHQVHSLY